MQTKILTSPLLKLVFREQLQISIDCSSFEGS